MVPSNSPKLGGKKMGVCDGIGWNGFHWDSYPSIIFYAIQVMDEHIISLYFPPFHPFHRSKHTMFFAMGLGKGFLLHSLFHVLVPFSDFYCKRFFFIPSFWFFFRCPHDSIEIIKKNARTFQKGKKKKEKEYLLGYSIDNDMLMS